MLGFWEDDSQGKMMSTHTGNRVPRMTVFKRTILDFVGSFPRKVEKEGAFQGVEKACDKKRL